MALLSFVVSKDSGTALNQAVSQKVSISEMFFFQEVCINYCHLYQAIQSLSPISFRVGARRLLPNCG